MISLNFRDSRPIYEQVKSSLIRMISTGAIAADEKLPSVRELASSLAINPNTIQKAYAQLEAEGYIYTVSGRGSFACSEQTVSAKRRSELMDELEKLVDEMIEFSVSKDELHEIIDEIFNKKNGKKGGGRSDKS